MAICDACFRQKEGRWIDDEAVGKTWMKIMTFVGFFIICCGMISILVGLYADFWSDENDIYPGYVYPYPDGPPEHIRNKMCKANGYMIIGTCKDSYRFSYFGI